MTPRERFLQSILFGKPDRVPLIPGNGRESTRSRWYSEGLPRDVGDIAEYAYREAGGTDPWPRGGEGFPVNTRMIPEFEEKVLEVRDRSQIVQDWKGNVCEIGLEFTTAHLRNAIDFCTRRWIRCPVESRADWESMKARFDASDPARMPPDAPERGRRLAAREHTVTLWISGPFWQLREWLGFENLCMMLHDDPAFIREMLAHYEAFVAQILQRTFQHVIPDLIHVSEDIAYKQHPMISPAMMREFLMPSYVHWGNLIREAGVPVYDMDSDGYVGDLIPLWIEAGFNLCDPMEIAAGNDLLEFRRRFGKGIAFMGGIDKRAIARGGKAIVEEIRRVKPLIREGGYIPTCDHGVPSDVSWNHFVRYVGLLAEATGWR